MFIHNDSLLSLGKEASENSASFTPLRIKELFSYADRGLTPPPPVYEHVLNYKAFFYALPLLLLIRLDYKPQQGVLHRPM